MAPDGVCLLSDDKGAAAGAVWSLREGEQPLQAENAWNLSGHEMLLPGTTNPQ